MFKLLRLKHLINVNGEVIMTVHLQLDKWMQVASEALDYFVNQVLNPNGFVEAKPLHLIEEYNTPLSGASLILQCGELFRVNVELLSDPKHLKQIARTMFDMSDNEPISDEDVVDAIKESVNMLSGGIKSRLTDQIEGEILLGIPTFIVEKKLQKTSEEAIRSEMDFGEMPIYLSIELLK